MSEDAFQTAIASQSFSLAMEVQERPENDEGNEEKDEKKEPDPPKVGIILFLSCVHLQFQTV